jgi:hypothetical protein
MDFYGLLPDTESASDLFVQFAGRDLRHDLSFPRSQRSDVLFDHPQVFILRARHAARCDGLRDYAEQLVGIDGLLETTDSVAPLVAI